MPHLEYVDLRGTAINDVALDHLKKLPALRHCYLSNTPIHYLDAAKTQFQGL